VLVTTANTIFLPGTSGSPQPKQLCLQLPPVVLLPSPALSTLWVLMKTSLSHSCLAGSLICCEVSARRSTVGCCSFPRPQLHEHHHQHRFCGPLFECQDERERSRITVPVLLPGQVKEMAAVRRRRCNLVPACLALDDPGDGASLIDSLNRSPLALHRAASKQQQQ